MPQTKQSQSDREHLGHFLKPLEVLLILIQRLHLLRRKVGLLIRKRLLQFRPLTRPAIPIRHPYRSLLIEKDILGPDIPQNHISLLILSLGLNETKEQVPQFLFSEEVFLALPVVDFIAE